MTGEMPGEQATVIHDGYVILECNDAFCELFRCTCEEIVGKHMQDLIGDHDLRRLAVTRGKRIMSEPADKEYTQDYVFLRCDRSTFWGRSFSQRIAPHRYKTWISGTMTIKAMGSCG